MLLHDKIEVIWAKRFIMWQHGRRVSPPLYAFRSWLGLQEARIHVQDEIADRITADVMK